MSADKCRHGVERSTICKDCDDEAAEGRRTHHPRARRYGPSAEPKAHGSANYRDMWAVVFPDGHIVTGSDLKTEDDAWRIALGWPGPEEIEDAKHRGVFSVKARLRFGYGTGYKTRADSVLDSRSGET